MRRARSNKLSPPDSAPPGARTKAARSRRAGRSSGVDAGGGDDVTDGGVPAGDVAFILGRDEHGAARIIRRRSEDAPIETGLLQPLREGKSIDGEVVSLRRRRDMPFLFDVKTELADPRAATPAPESEPRAVEARNDGPSQVATDAYRKGWDAIFGRRGRSTVLN
jgi:hypothetical protein